MSKIVYPNEKLVGAYKPAYFLLTLVATIFTLGGLFVGYVFLQFYFTDGNPGSLMAIAFALIWSLISGSGVVWGINILRMNPKDISFKVESSKRKRR
jgi:hypothetical protein